MVRCAVCHAQSSPHRLRIQRQVHPLSAHDQRQGDRARVHGKGEASIGISKVPDARLDRLTAMYNPQKRVPATVEFSDLAAPGQTGGAQALVDVAGLQERRRAGPRRCARFDDPAVAASVGLGRSGARRAGDGRRADPRRPRRGRAPARAARKGSEEGPHGGARTRTRGPDALPGGARRGPPAARARSEGRRPEAAARISVSLRQAAAHRHQPRRSQTVRRATRRRASIEARGRAAGLTAFLSRAATAAVGGLRQDRARDRPTRGRRRGGVSRRPRAAESGLDRVIRASYDLLGYISFFTVGEDECRAWSIPRGTAAQLAAGEIHSDIARGFIRAEVVGYDALVARGSMAACRDHGEVRLEGKEYVVQDGDIINFRFAT